MDSLTWGDKALLSPEISVKLEFIDDFIYLGSVISNEDGFEFKEVSIK